MRLKSTCAETLLFSLRKPKNNAATPTQPNPNPQALLASHFLSLGTTAKQQPISDPGVLPLLCCQLAEIQIGEEEKGGEKEESSAIKYGGVNNLRLSFPTGKKAIVTIAGHGRSEKENLFLSLFI